MVFLYLIVGVSAVIFLYYGVGWLYGRIARLLQRMKVMRSKAVVLTFDDGPGAAITPVILELLSQRKVKGTFFLRGRYVERHEDIVRRIISNGHEICSHGYDHLNYWKVSPFRAIDDIRRGWKSLDSVSGKANGVYTFRPPYGKVTVICLIYLWLKGAGIAYWTEVSGDTWDEFERKSDGIAKAIEKSKGAVALFHDFDRSDKKTSQFVLESLNNAITAANDNGLNIVTYSELSGETI